VLLCLIIYSQHSYHILHIHKFLTAGDKERSLLGRVTSKLDFEATWLTGTVSYQDWDDWVTDWYWTTDSSPFGLSLDKTKIPQDGSTSYLYGYR